MLSNIWILEQRLFPVFEVELVKDGKSSEWVSTYIVGGAMVPA
jgi:hypothetical protein